MPANAPDTTYLIQKGDTLWDISQGQLRDPFLWPKLWQANQRIKNPDLSYPGNQIVIPAELAKPQKATETAAAPSAPAPETPGTVATAETPPHPAAVPQAVEAPSGEAPTVIVGGPWLRAMSPTIRIVLPPSARVVRAKEKGKVIMAEPDEVYLAPKDGGSFTIGQTVMVYRPVKKVYHPVTGKFMGTLIRPLALAQVSAVEKDVTVTRIRRSIDYIQKGDLVTDFSSMTTDAAEPATAGGSVSGVVAEVQEDRILSADRDIIFLDRGKNAGLRIGDHLRVIRPGESVADCCRFGKRLRLPDNPIGEIEVLVAQGETATALIVKTNDSVLIGDRVVSMQ